MSTGVSDDVPVPSTSSDTISEEKKKEITIQAINLLAQGKRNLLCQEIPTAVDQLQEASKLLASTFGETSKECAEVYLTYGRALLELARLENGVLGNALQGVPSEEEGELSADDQFEKTDGIKESGENSQNDTGEVTTDDTKSDAEKGKEDDDKKEEEDANNEEDGDEEGDVSMEDDDEDVGEEDAEGCATENPDDVSNFQLAWEVLELAKIIYLKETEDKMKLKASEACMMLGEISLETEQYEKAINDMTQCLTIQMNHLEPENRLIAETHYQLGLAYLFNAQHHDALKNLETAISVIKTKIDKLKNIEENGDTADMENPKERAQREITELEGILPEILSKVEDVKEEMKNFDAVKAMAKEAFTNAIENVPAFQSSDKPETTTAGKVNDIGHMIRKKRKPQTDETTPEDNEAKKSRPDVSEAKVGEPEKDGRKEATDAGHNSTPNGVENGVCVMNGKPNGEKSVPNGVDTEHTTNGHVTADEAAGDTGGKMEITVKTVEDVKAATEKAEEMETDVEPQST